MNPNTKKGIAGGIVSGIVRSKNSTTAPGAVVQKSFVMFLSFPQE